MWPLLAVCLFVVQCILWAAWRKVNRKWGNRAPTPPSQIPHSSTTPETSPPLSTLPYTLLDDHTIARDSLSASQVFESDTSSDPPEALWSNCNLITFRDRRAVEAILKGSAHPESSTTLQASPTAITTDPIAHDPLLVDPTTKLPPELFGPILCLAAENPRTAIIEDHGGVAQRTYSAPLAFLRVSKTWQAFATAEPRLWTTIAVRPSHKTLADVFDGIERWIKHSGPSIRLSIFLNMDRLTWEPSDAVIPADSPYAYVGRCFGLMKEKQDRWDAVGLRVPYPTLAGLLPFDTTGIGYFSIRSLDSTEELPMNVPDNLRALRLHPTHIVHLHYEPLPETFAFNNIVQLQLPNCSMSIESARKLLSSIRVSLEVLSINIDDVHGQPSQSAAAIKLRRLTTLDIFAASNQILTSILGRLETPRLTSVTVRMHHGFSSFPSLLSLLKRSHNPEIQTFNLLCRGILPLNDLLVFLGTNPSLLCVNLCVHTSWFNDIGYPAIVTDEFFLRLAPPQTPESNNVLLPNLRKLTYHGPQDFAWENVLEVCRNRLRPQPHSAVCLMDRISIRVKDHHDGNGPPASEETKMGFRELCRENQGRAQLHFAL